VFEGIDFTSVSTSYPLNLETVLIVWYGIMFIFQL